jgi:hemin uptake protein HemP
MKEMTCVSGKSGAETFDPAKPLQAEQLLAPHGQVQIAFKGQIYTLSQTRNDKLILTK